MQPDFIRQRITQLRLQKGVSEYQMSYDLGHSRGYINNISSGRTLPSMTEFLAICDYFGISPSAFFQSEIEAPSALQSLLQELAKLNHDDLQLVEATVNRLNALHDRGVGHG